MKKSRIAATVAAIQILAILVVANASFAASFTMPPKEDMVFRKLDYMTELRFLRRVVGKINRVPGYNIEREEKYWVPNDPEKYRDWSPIPEFWGQYAEYPKMILIIMDEYLQASLEYGHVIDWSNMLSGPAGRPGAYSVQAKVKDKVSSYRDEDGKPIPMPNALRIYGRVWSHGGDAYGPHHVGKGCFNTPNEYAVKVFDWAEIGTTVVVLRDWR